MLFKVKCADLLPGMFVAELDRPWIETQFLIQGFVIESDEEIERLRQVCEFVYVDGTRSTGEALRFLRMPLASARAGESASEGSTAEKSEVTSPASREPERPPTTVNEIRNPEPQRQRPPANNVPSEREVLRATMGDATGRFMRMAFGELDENTIASAPPFPIVAKPARRTPRHILSGLAQHLLWRIRRRGVARPDPRNASAELPKVETPVGLKRSECVPQDIEVVYYPETNTAAEELVLARIAYKRATRVFERILKNIQRGRKVDLERMDEVMQDVVDSMMRNPDALMWLGRMRQQEVSIHGYGLHVAIHMVLLGRHLGLPRDHLARLGIAGILLDIGKAEVPEELLRRPGRLSESEFEVIEKHVTNSIEKLGDVPGVHADVGNAIAQHHEREDGSGYPKRLVASEISLYGRIAAITDTFVALTNPRVYAQMMSPYEAMRKLMQWSAKLFNRPLVEQFIQAIGVFPVGSLVELSSGEVAVVIRQSKARKLKPRVLIVCGTDKKLLPNPTYLDLLYQRKEEGGEQVSIVRSLPAGAYDLDQHEFYLP